VRFVDFAMLQLICLQECVKDVGDINSYRSWTTCSGTTTGDNRLPH
jgi:hypothetical protein